MVPVAESVPAGHLSGKWPLARTNGFFKAALPAIAEVLSAAGAGEPIEPRLILLLASRS
jgi:hypothetical protein